MYSHMCRTTGYTEIFFDLLLSQHQQRLAQLPIQSGPDDFQGGQAKAESDHSALSVSDVQMYGALR